MLRAIRVVLIVAIITFVLLELLVRLWFGGLAEAVAPQYVDNTGLFPDGLYSDALTLTANYTGIAPTGIEYTTNEYGLRDDTINPDNRLWLFLGDSTTFGLNIAHADTYAQQLERLVGDDIQTVNAAVPGWGTAEQLNTLTRLLDDGLQFEVVTIAFFANDPRNNMVYEARQTNAPSLLKQSALYRLVDGYSETARIHAALNLDWMGDSQRPDLWQYKEWQITRGYLDQLIVTARNNNAQVALLYIPFNEQETLNSSSIDIALREYTQSQGIAYISGIDVYQVYLSEHGLTNIPQSFYSRGNDMAHPSPLTSGLLAHALYEVLN